MSYTDFQVCSKIEKYIRGLEPKKREVDFALEVNFTLEDNFLLEINFLTELSYNIVMNDNNMNNLADNMIRFNIGSIEPMGWGEQGSLVIAIDYTNLPEIKTLDETTGEMWMTDFGYSLLSEIETILRGCEHSEFQYMVGSFGFVVDDLSKTARGKLVFNGGKNWAGRRAFRNEVISRLCSHRLLKLNRKIDASELYTH